MKTPSSDGVKVESLEKAFGPVRVLRGLSFEAPAGRLTALLGPSGAGKTTALRIIAGVEDPDAGGVSICGRAAAGGGVSLPPAQRGIGMVFQAYALWPHLSVFENIAFPLRVRHRPDDEVRSRVAESLDLLRLPASFAGRRPHELSGGEQQRVALGRALIHRPQVLLLDEPLANLDAGLRQGMRGEIRRLQQELGITTIYVTHDQAEARVLADRVVLMAEGKTEQEGKPREVYEKPATPFAARFLGLAPGD